jgi:hypothetical protein
MIGSAIYCQLVEEARESFSRHPPDPGEVLSREFFSGRHELSRYGTIVEIVPPARTPQAMKERFDKKEYYPCCLQVYAHLFSCKRGPWSFE